MTTIVNCTTGNKEKSQNFSAWEEAACFNNNQYDQIWSNLSVQTFAINNPSCPLKTASNSITAEFVAQQIKLPWTSEGFGRIKYKVNICYKNTIHNPLYCGSARTWPINLLRVLFVSGYANIKGYPIDYLNPNAVPRSRMFWFAPNQMPQSVAINCLFCLCRWLRLLI